MAKGSKDVKDTRVLYKKSMSTIRTHSKTYSVQTQLVPKGGKHELKQKLSQEHKYYNDGKKLKRDLSIETDICIMRNNIRSKKNKMSYQELYSDKSKTSNFTIGDSLLVNDKFEAGNSNARLQNTDVVSLIVDNFRALLNNWIREYLYDSSDNLDKIDAIREALVQRLEQEVIRVSMTSGILNTTSQHSNLNKPRRRLRSIYAPRDVNIFNCEVNCSNYTVPFQSNRYRMPNSNISKHISKSRLICQGKNSSGTHLFKMKNQKNVLVSIQKSKEVFIDSSNYVMLAMSSRSRKCCTSYDETKSHKDISLSNETLEVKKGPFTPIIRALPGFSDCLHDIVKHKCFRKSDYHRNSLVREIYGVPSQKINKPITSKTNCTDYSQVRIAGKTKSCVPEKNKSLPTETIKGATSKEKNKEARKVKCFCEKSTMIDCHTRDPMAEGQCNIPRCQCNCVPKTNRNISSNDGESIRNQPIRDLKDRPSLTTREKRSRCVSQSKPVVELDQIKRGNYSYSTKKPLNNEQVKKALVCHIQDIFSYFDTHDDHEEIRLDVHVNVLPVVRDETIETQGKMPCRYSLIQDEDYDKTTTTVHQVCAVKCGPLDTLPEFCETESSTTKESKCSESNKDQEIISILDGARSDVKYIMVSENNSVQAETKEFHNENVDTTVINNQQSMYYQIKALKDVVQYLAKTAEKIKEEMMRERRFNTSCSTQVELGPQYFTMINSLRSTQTENTSNNEPYALWFSQQTMNHSKVPELMEQMINAELKNYEISMESPQPTSDPIALSPAVTTVKDTKPHNINEKRNNDSKGIQFSYNFSQVNHCSGFKLQTVLKTPSCTKPVKKPSFAFTESESIIKVTDMTSIPKMSHNRKQNKVSFMFPYLPLHVEAYEEKGIQNASTTASTAKQKSDALIHEEHEPSYNFTPNVESFNDPSSSHGSQLKHDNISKYEQKRGLDIEKNDSMFMILDEKQDKDRRDRKFFKTKYIKFYKTGFYCVLLCTSILVLTMIVYYISTKRANEIKPTTETVKLLEQNNTSDLPELLSDFGF